MADYFDKHPKLQKGLIIYTALQNSKIIDPTSVIGGAANYLILKINSPTDFNNMTKIVLSPYQDLVEYFYDT